MRCAVCRSRRPLLYRSACDECNRSRLRAAVEFIRASEAVRTLTGMGATTGWHVRRTRRHLLIEATKRMEAADAACVDLGIWSPSRTTKRPPYFYGDERSKTR